jgi:hypothetical protein
MTDIRYADHAVTLFYVSPDAFRYGAFGWRDMEPADRHYSDVTIPVLLVNDTSYSDYSGSMYNRSNNRVLMGDGCRVLREVTGDYSSSALVLTLPRAVVRRLTRAGRNASARMACEALADMIDADTLDDARAMVCDVIAGLADYPIIDESDYSELESEYIYSDESWETVRDDMALAVAREITGANGRDAWEFAGLMKDDPTESASFRAWFGEFMSGHNYYPHCEDAMGSVHWEGIDDDAVKVIIDSVRDNRRFPWLSLAKTYAPTDTYTLR